VDYGKPFNRKDFFMNIGYYIEKGWGSYKELISLSMRDIAEIKIGIESRQQEDMLSKALGGG
jgi:hypothetical protein